MNKPNITPGPWEIKGQNIIGNDVNGFVCTWSGRSADARAISAVPEMISALLEAQEIIQIETGSSSFAIEQALKKAGVEL